MYLDLGTGDGSFIYKAASLNPHTFFVGVDSNIENMAFYAQKASASAKKGGLPNVLFVHAGAEKLPDELAGLVTSVTVNFPWGSLLKAVACPDPEFLCGLKKVARGKASFQTVFSYEPNIEKKVMEELVLPPLSSEHLEALKRSYAYAGFAVKWRMIPQGELKAFPSSWAKRLAFGRPRPCVELKGSFG